MHLFAFIFPLIWLGSFVFEFIRTCPRDFVACVLPFYLWFYYFFFLSNKHNSRVTPVDRGLLVCLFRSLCQHPSVQPLTPGGVWAAY